MRTKEECDGGPAAAQRLLLPSRRRTSAAQIRRDFLQIGPRGSKRAGLLANLVANGDGRALDTYLLTLGMATGTPAPIRLDPELWAQALGVVTQDNLRALRKVVIRLERHRLLRRLSPAGQVVEVLREDGSGSPYKRPGATGLREPYLKLPLNYWIDDAQWHRELSLPGKAMLLIALSQRDGFSIPLERVPDWYGISADTALRGFLELRDSELLAVKKWAKAAPTLAHGKTKKYLYSAASWLRDDSSGLAA